MKTIFTKTIRIFLIVSYFAFCSGASSGMQNPCSNDGMFPATSCLAPPSVNRGNLFSQGWELGIMRECFSQQKQACAIVASVKPQVFLYHEPSIGDKVSISYRFIGYGERKQVGLYECWVEGSDDRYYLFHNKAAKNSIQLYEQDTFLKDYQSTVKDLAFRRFFAHEVSTDQPLRKAHRAGKVRPIPSGDEMMARALAFYRQRGYPTFVDKLQMRITNQQFFVWQVDQGVFSDDQRGHASWQGVHVEEHPDIMEMECSLVHELNVLLGKDDKENYALEESYRSWRYSAQFTPDMLNHLQADVSKPDLWDLAGLLDLTHRDYMAKKKKKKKKNGLHPGAKNKSSSQKNTANGIPTAAVVESPGDLAESPDKIVARLMGITGQLPDAVQQLHRICTHMELTRLTLFIQDNLQENGYIPEPSYRMLKELVQNGQFDQYGQVSAFLEEETQETIDVLGALDNNPSFYDPEASRPSQREQKAFRSFLCLLSMQARKSLGVCIFSWRFQQGISLDILKELMVLRGDLPPEIAACPEVSPCWDMLHFVLEVIETMEQNHYLPRHMYDRLLGSLSEIQEQRYANIEGFFEEDGADAQAVRSALDNNPSFYDPAAARPSQEDEKDFLDFLHWLGSAMRIWLDGSALELWRKGDISLSCLRDFFGAPHVAEGLAAEIIGFGKCAEITDFLFEVIIQFDQHQRIPKHVYDKLNRIMRDPENNQYADTARIFQSNDVLAKNIRMALDDNPSFYDPAAPLAPIEQRHSLRYGLHCCIGKAREWTEDCGRRLHEGGYHQLSYKVTLLLVWLELQYRREIEIDDMTLTGTCCFPTGINILYTSELYKRQEGLADAEKKALGDALMATILEYYASYFAVFFSGQYNASDLKKLADVQLGHFIYYISCLGGALDLNYVRDSESYRRVVRSERLVERVIAFAGYAFSWQSSYDYYLLKRADFRARRHLPIQAYRDYISILEFVDEVRENTPPSGTSMELLMHLCHIFEEIVVVRKDLLPEALKLYKEVLGVARDDALRDNLTDVNWNIMLETTEYMLWRCLLSQRKFQEIEDQILPWPLDKEGVLQRMQEGEAPVARELAMRRATVVLEVISALDHGRTDAITCQQLEQKLLQLEEIYQEAYSDLDGVHLLEDEGSVQDVAYIVLRSGGMAHLYLRMSQLMLACNLQHPRAAHYQQKARDAYQTLMDLWADDREAIRVLFSSELVYAGLALGHKVFVKDYILALLEKHVGPDADFTPPVDSPENNLGFEMLYYLSFFFSDIEPIDRLIAEWLSDGVDDAEMRKGFLQYLAEYSYVPQCAVFVDQFINAIETMGQEKRKPKEIREEFLLYVNEYFGRYLGALVDEKKKAIVFEQTGRERPCPGKETVKKLRDFLAEGLDLAMKKHKSLRDALKKMRKERYDLLALCDRVLASFEVDDVADSGLDARLTACEAWVQDQVPLFMDAPDQVLAGIKERERELGQVCLGELVGETGRRLQILQETLFQLRELCIAGRRMGKAYEDHSYRDARDACDSLPDMHCARRIISEWQDRIDACLQAEQLFWNRSDETLEEQIQPLPNGHRQFFGRWQGARIGMDTCLKQGDFKGATQHVVQASKGRHTQGDEQYELRLMGMVDEKRGECEEMIASLQREILSGDTNPVLAIEKLVALYPGNDQVAGLCCELCQQRHEICDTDTVIALCTLLLRSEMPEMLPRGTDWVKPMFHLCMLRKAYERVKAHFDIVNAISVVKKYREKQDKKEQRLEMSFSLVSIDGIKEELSLSGFSQPGWVVPCFPVGSTCVIMRKALHDDGKDGAIASKVYLKVGEDEPDVTYEDEYLFTVKEVRQGRVVLCCRDVLDRFYEGSGKSDGKGKSIWLEEMTCQQLGAQPNKGNGLTVAKARNVRLKKKYFRPEERQAENLYEHLQKMEALLRKGLDNLDEDGVRATGSEWFDQLFGLKEAGNGCVAGSGALAVRKQVRGRAVTLDKGQEQGIRDMTDAGSRVVVIQGPPGTGKTFTNEEAILINIKEGIKKAYRNERPIVIAVLSQSHQGCDNLLKRVFQMIEEEGALREECALIRVGACPAKIKDPGLYMAWQERKYRYKKATGQIGAKKMIPIIVAGGTLNGFRNDTIMQELFLDEKGEGKVDICVVDEAGRATVAESLLPLKVLRADGRIFYVGDQNQLEPQELSREELDKIKADAVKSGSYTASQLEQIFDWPAVKDYRRSLLEIVYDEIFPFLERAGLRTSPKEFYDVNRRSLPPIVLLNSLLFYQGRIRPDPEACEHILNRESVRVIDTGALDDPQQYQESKQGTSRVNYGEVAIMLEELDELLDKRRIDGEGQPIATRGSGKGVYRYSERDILLLSPYKAQLECIRDTLPAWVALNQVERIITEGSPATNEEQLAELWEKIREYCQKHWKNERVEFGEQTLSLEQACQQMKQVGDETVYRDYLDTLCDLLQIRLPLASCRRVRVGDDNGLQDEVFGDMLQRQIAEFANMEVDVGLVSAATVDSIQGGEAPVAIVSLVAGNERNNIGFLNNMHRLCVALSRAEEQLRIIGDISGTLSRAEYRIRDNLGEYDQLRQEDQKQSTERARGVFEAVGILGQLYDEYRNNPAMTYNELAFLGRVLAGPVFQSILQEFFQKNKGRIQPIVQPQQFIYKNHTLTYRYIGRGSSEVDLYECWIKGNPSGCYLFYRRNDSFSVRIFNQEALLQQYDRIIEDPLLKRFFAHEVVTDSRLKHWHEFHNPDPLTATDERIEKVIQFLIDQGYSQFATRLMEKIHDQQYAIWEVPKGLFPEGKRGHASWQSIHAEEGDVFEETLVHELGILMGKQDVENKRLEKAYVRWKETTRGPDVPAVPAMPGYDRWSIRSLLDLDRRDYAAKKKKKKKFTRNTNQNGGSQKKGRDNGNPNSAAGPSVMYMLIDVFERDQKGLAGVPSEFAKARDQYSQVAELYRAMREEFEKEYERRKLEYKQYLRHHPEHAADIRIYEKAVDNLTEVQMLRFRVERDLIQRGTLHQQPGERNFELDEVFSELQITANESEELYQQAKDTHASAKEKYQELLKEHPALAAYDQAQRIAAYVQDLYTVFSAYRILMKEQYVPKEEFEKLVQVIHSGRYPELQEILDKGDRESQMLMDALALPEDAAIFVRGKANTDMEYLPVHDMFDYTCVIIRQTIGPVVDLESQYGMQLVFILGLAESWFEIRYRDEIASRERSHHILNQAPSGLMVLYKCYRYNHIPKPEQENQVEYKLDKEILGLLMRFYTDLFGAYADLSALNPFVRTCFVDSMVTVRDAFILANGTRDYSLINAFFQNVQQWIDQRDRFIERRDRAFMAFVGLQKGSVVAERGFPVWAYGEYEAYAQEAALLAVEQDPLEYVVSKMCIGSIFEEVTRIRKDLLPQAYLHHQELLDMCQDQQMKDTVPWLHWDVVMRLTQNALAQYYVLTEQFSKIEQELFPYPYDESGLRESKEADVTIFMNTIDFCRAGITYHAMKLGEEISMEQIQGFMERLDILERVCDFAECTEKQRAILMLQGGFACAYYSLGQAIGLCRHDDRETKEVLIQTCRQKAHYFLGQMMQLWQEDRDLVQRKGNMELLYAALGLGFSEGHDEFIQFAQEFFAAVVERFLELLPSNAIPHLRGTQEDNPGFRICYLLHALPIWLPRAEECGFNNIDEIIVHWLTTGVFVNEQVQQAVLRYLAEYAIAPCLSEITQWVVRELGENQGRCLKDTLDLFVKSYFIPYLKTRVDDKQRVSIKRQTGREPVMPIRMQIEELKQLMGKYASGEFRKQLKKTRATLYEAVALCDQMLGVLSGGDDVFPEDQDQARLQEFQTWYEAQIVRVVSEPHAVMEAIACYSIDVLLVEEPSVMEKMKFLKSVCDLARTMQKFYATQEFDQAYQASQELYVKLAGVSVPLEVLQEWQERIALCRSADNLFQQGSVDEVALLIDRLPDDQQDFFQRWVGVSRQVSGELSTGSFDRARRVLDKANHRKESTAGDRKYESVIEGHIRLCEEEFRSVLVEGREALEAGTAEVLEELTHLLVRYPLNEEVLDLCYQVCVSRYQDGDVEKVIEVCVLLFRRLVPERLGDRASWIRRMFFVCMARRAQERIRADFGIVNTISKVKEYREKDDQQHERLEMSFSLIEAEGAKEELVVRGFRHPNWVPACFPVGSSCVIMRRDPDEGDMAIADRIDLRVGEKQNETIAYYEEYIFTVKEVLPDRVVLCCRDVIERFYEGKDATDGREKKKWLEGLAKKHLNARRHKDAGFKVAKKRDVRLRKKYFRPEQRQAEDLSQYLRKLGRIVPEAKNIRAFCNGDVPITTGDGWFDRLFGLVEASNRYQKNNRLKVVRKQVRGRFVTLDEGQRKGIKDMTDGCHKVVLTQGPPGTGKTFTNEEAILINIRENKEVAKRNQRPMVIAILSQSHQGCDNLLKRVYQMIEEDENLKEECSVIRVGSCPAKIKDVELYNLWQERKYRYKKATGQIGAKKMIPVIVAGGTLNGFRNDTIMQELFLDGTGEGQVDICVVDEAGRATVAESLLPLKVLRKDGRIFYVGDQNQLEPQELSKQEIDKLKKDAFQAGLRTEAQLEEVFGYQAVKGYGRSLLEIVYDEIYPFLERAGLKTSPKEFYDVNRRSLPPIVLLNSLLFYQGRIRPDPSLSDHVLNRESVRITDTAGTCKESKRGTSRVNYGEVAVMLKELDGELDKKKNNEQGNPIASRGTGLGIYRYSEKDILLLSPYKAQLECIQDTLPAWVAYNRAAKIIREGEATVREKELRSMWETVGHYCQRQWRGEFVRFGKETISLVQACQRMKEVGDGVTYLFQFDMLSGILEERLPRAACARVSALDSAGLQEDVFSEMIQKKIAQLANIEVEVGRVSAATVDSIQGGEAPVGIISLVRSNDKNSIGFLNNMHRLCVALSRAEEGLHIIGDISGTLRHARYEVNSGATGYERARQEDHAAATQRAALVFNSLGVMGQLYQQYTENPIMTYNELTFLAGLLTEAVLDDTGTPEAFLQLEDWSDRGSLIDEDHYFRRVRRYLYRIAPVWNLVGQEDDIWKVLNKAVFANMDWLTFEQKLENQIGTVTRVISTDGAQRTEKFADALKSLLEKLGKGRFWPCDVDNSRGGPCVRPVLSGEEQLQRAA